jgi:beta-glucanase (GH16 family)
VRKLIWLVAAFAVASAGCGAGGSAPTGASASHTPSPTAGATATAMSSATAAESATAESTATVPGYDGWKLVWHDEFDGAAGAMPDSANWGYDLGSNNGWGNSEREYYTSDPANASTDGKGNLVTTARKSDGSLTCWYGPCEYTSARLLTKNIYSVKYGRIEARIKVPAGAGTWPAFWMLGSNIDTVGWPGCGEIDVMEALGRTPNTLYGTLHGPGDKSGAGVGSRFENPAPLSNDYHVYGVDWTPSRVTFTIDGHAHFAATPADVSSPWVFDHEFFIILNLAIGGAFGGNVAASTPFPAVMTIDYVRVYQQAG